jgi:hypothetical protein
MVTAVFVVWLLFFDKNDLITQYNTRKHRIELEKSREYYLQQIQHNKQDLQELMSDPKNLEKFGREKYLMKRDSEDVFVIVKKKKQETK